MHAFAQSSIGQWFVGFLIVIALVCAVAYFRNSDYLKSNNQLDSLVSRESSFLFNNLILLVACIAVISGTMFPVLSEWVQGQKISVGPPFFNHVNIPIGLMLLFLTGVGPLLAWRKTSLDSLKRNFTLPLVGGLIAGAIAWPLGCKNGYSLVCVILAFFVAFTIVFEFYRGAKVIHVRTGMNYLASAIDLTMRNTRRYGGYVIHFGMVLIFIGLAGGAFNQDKQMEMPSGSHMTIGAYTLNAQTFDMQPGPNYDAERVTIEVTKQGKSLMMLTPEKRNFRSSEESGTMVAIYSTPLNDLYVVYAGRNPETGQPVIHAYLNPLVKWIWFGGVVVIIGTILALLPDRKAAIVLRAVTQPAAPTIVAGVIPQIAPASSHHDGSD